MQNPYKLTTALLVDRSTDTLYRTVLCNLEQPSVTLHELEVNTLYFKDHCRELFRSHISRESGKSLASQQLCPTEELEAI